MALEQKLGEACGRAEVAVDPEDASVARGMAIEKIWASAVFHEQLERIPCHIAIEQPCPQPDGPCAAPSCVGTTVGQSPLQRLSRCLPQFRLVLRRDLPPRVDRVKMRHMSLAWLILVKVDGPLLELAILANLVGRQPFEGRLQRRSKLVVHLEIARCGAKVGE